MIIEGELWFLGLGTKHGKGDTGTMLGRYAVVAFHTYTQKKISWANEDVSRF